MRFFLPVIVFVAFLFTMPYSVICQYTETFSVANKGILNPGCTGPIISNCSNVDFGGVLWTIGGNLSGIDTEGFLTVGGVMSGSDVDEEVCWISPVLTLSSAANISVALTWAQYDFDDFINLEWEINGSGTWIQLPNQTGQVPTPPVPQYNTSLKTIGYNVAPGSNVSGSLTVNALSIGASGNTLKVRVCGDNNLTSEIFTLDNVTVTNASSLPVTWLNINGYSENNINKIYWKTASEINNDYFLVERSLDAVNFSTVGQVKGGGDTPEISNYEFIDESIKVGKVYYYRVKQTDFDGKFDYSPVVAVKNEKSISYSAIPNPFNNFLTIFTDSNSENEMVIISDINGRKIKEFTALNGDIDTSDLLPGVYFIKWSSGEISKVIKL
jgi:hypothetical protein